MTALCMPLVFDRASYTFPVSVIVCVSVMWEAENKTKAISQLKHTISATYPALSPYHPQTTRHTGHSENELSFVHNAIRVEHRRESLKRMRHRTLWAPGWLSHDFDWYRPHTHTHRHRECIPQRSKLNYLVILILLKQQDMGCWMSYRSKVIVH